MPIQGNDNLGNLVDCLEEKKCSSMLNIHLVYLASTYFTVLYSVHRTIPISPCPRGAYKLMLL